MRRAVVAVLALVALAACARDEPRPSGIAERWLQAVSDSGRDAIRDDATERATKYGDPSLAAPLRAPNPDEDERYFHDLEVGAADIDGDRARVPVRVTARLAGGDESERRASLLLTRTGDDWTVTAVEPAQAGDEVPSDGGDLPARASASQWLFALILGVLLTAGCVALIEAQPRSALSR